MSDDAKFLSATPVLASLDIERSVEFFCSVLGFTKVHAEQGVYGVVTRDEVAVHFWSCSEKHIAENTSCRIGVQGVESLYVTCKAAGVVHPNAPLSEKPWGTREFGVLDPDGNLITFVQPIDTSSSHRR